MSDQSSKLVQWKKLWQLVCGVYYQTPNVTVKEKLLAVSKELTDGLLQYKKHTQDSNKNLEKIMKENGQEKLLPFTQKLQQFLNLDGVQSWELLCFYLVNEYRGSATSLLNYITTEMNIDKLLNEIWSYYCLERTIALKIIKNIVEYSSFTSHPYHKEYQSLMKSIGLSKLRKSLIEQFEMLVNEAPPSKNPFGESSSIRLVLWAERRLKEISEIIQILILVVHYDGIMATELEKCVELFKQHAFGRQSQFLDPRNESHNDMMMKITYGEVILFLISVDLAERNRSGEWIAETVKLLDKQIMSMHQNIEHGPLLLAWMLLNFQRENILEDEDLCAKYRQFGSKAVKLGVFEYLHKILLHPTFKEKSLVARTARRTICNHVSQLCSLFDSDGSVAYHAGVYDLLSEVIDGELAVEFCRNESMGVRSVYQTAIEVFPVDFVPISKIAYSLGITNTKSFNYIKQQLENLPVYTELFDSQKYCLQPVPEAEDEFVLLESYTPFRKIDFHIPAGTKVTIIDRRNQSFAHFRVPFNFYNALHNEINVFLEDTLRQSEMDSLRVQRITAGVKFLAVAVSYMQSPSEIISEMVHPTEMVFDIFMKLKTIQNPPIELLAKCMDVCSALCPLYDTEILKRVVNLQVLPAITNQTLTFEAYANGVSFETGLVGSYLINFEKNVGRYDFLFAYFNFLQTFTKLKLQNVRTVELPGLLFLLREIFPHIHSWKFEQESDRYKVYILTMRYLSEVLQISDEVVKKDPSRKMLRDTCIYSLLNFENGMMLLRFVGIGNSFLQTIMERESHWMNAWDTGLNSIVHSAMTILMQVLRLKTTIRLSDKNELFPLERVIFTQPKQREALRIIPIVASYMNNIFNRFLPILACKLLTRFAIEFQMSVLACLDMEPDQIRLMFLERLRDNLENDEVKIAVLGFVEACIEKQPGLTEAFFKVTYNNERRLSVGKPKVMKSIGEGILIYMTEYLEAISTDSKMLASPLLSRIMSLFHALWKNNMQLLVKELLEKPNFWTSLCNPLFGEICNKNQKAYSQLFNILGIELFKSTAHSQMPASLKTIFNKFLDASVFERWATSIFNLPKVAYVRKRDDKIPDWLGQLQSFKDLIVLILRRRSHEVELSTASKKLLTRKCLQALTDRSNFLDDLRPLIVLSELYLVIVSSCNESYFEKPEDGIEMLENVAHLMNVLSMTYQDIHKRARIAIISIAIRALDFLDAIDIQNQSIKSNLIQSMTEIICNELFEIEKNTKMNVPIEKDDHLPIILSINLIKKTIVMLDERGTDWAESFIGSKIINRLLSCTSLICQTESKRKITVELLDLLITFARSSVSKDVLYCDIGEYLWLKLLPPKDLQQPILISAANTSTARKWQAQDWWAIYSRGIKLVTIMLAEHKHFFLKEALSFVDIHEEHLVDSIYLVKHSLDANASCLIKSSVELIWQLIDYEKIWRIENGQSMMNLMRCIQFVLDHTIFLLYRPRILQRLVDGSNALITLVPNEPTHVVLTEKLTTAMNEILEIMIMSCKSLLAFSPKLLHFLTETYFVPCQWQALVDVQFGAPTLKNDAFHQLTFGTFLSAVCILTKSLTLQQYSFHGTPLNLLPKKREHDTMDASVSSDSQINVTDNQISMLSVGSPTTSSRRTFSKSLSMSSTANFAVTPSNELLTSLDQKLCASALELMLTLLATQSLLALKDPNLSGRDKQMIRRELSTELSIFHDFVKKQILNEQREDFHRKKYGSVEMSVPRLNESDDDEDLPSGSHPPILRSAGVKNSMRVKVVRRLHLQGQKQSPEMSTPSKTILNTMPVSSSTPNKHVSESESTSKTQKRVSIAENDTTKKVCTNDDEEIQLFDPEEPKYTGLSYVQIVEEDYFHLLSNVLHVICDAES